MSSQPENTPHDQSESSDQAERVTVRRSPKYFAFASFGAIVGLLVSMVVAISTPASKDLTQLQAFGWLALWLIPLFGAAALVIALVFDWVGNRRAKEALATKVQVRLDTHDTVDETDETDETDEKDEKEDS